MCNIHILVGVVFRWCYKNYFIPWRNKKVYDKERDISNNYTNEKKHLFRILNIMRPLKTSSSSLIKVYGNMDKDDHFSKVYVSSIYSMNLNWKN